MSRVPTISLAALVLLSLVLSLAGCHQGGGDAPPPAPAPALTPQQQVEASQMAAGRAADAQRSAAGKTSGH